LPEKVGRDPGQCGVGRIEPVGDMDKIAKIGRKLGEETGKLYKNPRGKLDKETKSNSDQDMAKNLGRETGEMWAGKKRMR
jgi:hypothetical protein